MSIFASLARSISTRQLLICGCLVAFIIALVGLQYLTAHMLPFNETEALVMLQSQTVQLSTTNQPPLINWLLYLWQYAAPPALFASPEVWFRTLGIVFAAGIYIALFSCCRIYFATDAWYVWAWSVFFYALLLIAHYNALFDITATVFTLLYLILLAVAFRWLRNADSIIQTLLLACVVFLLVQSHFIAWVIVPIVLFLLLALSFHTLRTSKQYWSIWGTYCVALLPTLYWNYQTNWVIFTYLQSHFMLPIAWLTVLTHQLVFTAVAGIVALPIATFMLYKRWSEPNAHLLYFAALLLWVCGMVFALFHLATSAITVASNLLFVVFLVRYIAWHKVNSILGYVWLLSLSYGAVTLACFYLLYAALAVPFPRFMNPLADFLGVKESVSLIDSFESTRLNLLDKHHANANAMIQNTGTEGVFFDDDVSYIFTNSLDYVGRLSWYAGASRVVYLGAEPDNGMLTTLGLPPLQKGMSGYVLINDDATVRQLNHESRFAQCQLLSTSVYRGNTDNAIARMHIYQCAGYLPPA